MSTPPGPQTFTTTDGATIQYTPPPPTGTTPPAPSSGGPYQPTLPAAQVARLNTPAVMDDTFTKPETWGTEWDDAWFGGERFNNQPLAVANITWPSGGGVSLGVSDGGKTGCLIHTNPSDQNKPGFQIGYGYVECDISFPANNPAWACFWLNGQSWPNNGENDVIEWVQSGGGHVPSFNYHGSPSQNGADSPQNSGQIAGAWNGRHHFGVLRTPDNGGTSYAYWNGILLGQHPTYDKGAPQYVILSIGDYNAGGNGPMIVYRCTAWTLNH